MRSPCTAGWQAEICVLGLELGSGQDVSVSGEIPGARPGPMVDREEFDRELLMTGRSELLWRLTAQACGDEYPVEVQPWSDTTWWLLGRCVSGLRIGPGAVLGDLACGRGGPGLWLARATGASLIGVDWSEVAIGE